MTPKEKAEELTSKFLEPQRVFNDEKVSVSKECALIAVEEIISAIYDKDFRNMRWSKVKSEIEKL